MDSYRICFLPGQSPEDCGTLVCPTHTWWPLSEMNGILSQALGVVVSKAVESELSFR